MISKEPSTEVVLSFYQNYIIPLYDDEDPVIFIYSGIFKKS
jgi:hypothetical protein